MCGGRRRGRARRAFERTIPIGRIASRARHRGPDRLSLLRSRAAHHGRDPERQRRQRALRMSRESRQAVASCSPRNLVDRLPTLEAAPVVLARGAHLVGKAEAVRPSLFACAPGAVPGEGEAPNGVDAKHLDDAGEVGAAGLRVDAHRLDREIALGVRRCVRSRMILMCGTGRMEATRGVRVRSWTERTAALNSPVAALSSRMSVRCIRG